MQQICPLYQSKDSKILQDFVTLFEKVANRRAINPKIFEETHFEIFAYVNEKKIKENNLFEIIYPKNNQNKGSKCVVILGEPGIGKSELCTYFRNKLINENLEKYILYLDKSVALYDIITDRLPNFYKQATGQKIIDDYEERFKLLKKPSLAAAAVLYHMLKRLDRELPAIFENDKPIQQNILIHLGEGIKRIYQKNEQQTESSGLNIFDQYFIKKHINDPWMRAIRSFFKNEDSEQLAERLNEAFSHGVTDASGIPSFSRLLIKIAKEIDHKIWIIFEDYDLPYLDNKEILGFAEADQTEIDIQFVMALVPGRWDVLKKMLTGTFEQRATFIDFKEGKDNFLNTDTCLKFIEPFLKYHKKHYSQYCKDCGKCPQDIITTFPMNYLFLKRIFDGLSIEKRNPRKYVEYIGMLLKDFIDENIAPYDNKHILGEIVCTDIPIDLNDGLESLSAWYFKDINKQDLEKWCELFNIEFEKTQKEKTNPEKPKPESIPIVDEKWNLLLGQLRNYLESPTDPRFKPCGDTIQIGLKKVLSFVTDDYCILSAWSNKSSPEIIYNFPGEGNILSITKQKNSLSFNFNPLQLPQKVGEKLLEIGYNKSLTNNLKNHFSVELTQCIVPMIFEWREKVKQYYCSQKFGEKNEDFNKLVLLCYKLLENFENPFNFDDKKLQLEKNGFQYIKNGQLEKLGEKLIEHIDYKPYISELLQWNYSIGGDVYPSRLNDIVNPWDELKNFQKSKVDKILDGNLRYKHSGPKVELSTLLQKIFIFAKELNDKQYSKEIDNNQFTQISNFISNITEKNIFKIKIASDLSSLDGKQIKSVLRKISELDFNTFISLKKMVDIFLLEKNEGLRAIQVKYLFNIELYSLLIDIISNSIYINKSKNHITLVDFCEELINDNEKEKGKKEHEEFEKQKKRIIVLIKNIEILEKANEIKDGIVKPDLTTLKNIEDIQKYISIYEKKWRSYIEKERGSLENLDRLNDIFKILTEDEMNMKPLFNEFENNPSIETLNSYIEKRNTIHDKLKDVVPTLGTEKVIKLLKGEKILFSNLNKNEVDDIFRSKLKEILSIGLGNK
jgi:hypothetical protein